MESLRIGLVGYGRLGRAIVRTFGRQIVSVCSHSVDANGISTAAGMAVPSVSVDDIAAAYNPDLIWLAVPDDAIAEVADAIAGSHANGRRPVLLHSSGSHGIGPLKGAEQAGFLVGALHPNLIIDGTEPLSSGATWGVTGSDEVLAVCRRLLAEIDPVLVAVDESNRTLYHVAATLVANYPIVLADLAEQLYTGIGFSDEDARRVVASYLRLVASRMESSDPTRRPVEQMTGPVVRDDRDTLLRHVRGLEERGMEPESDLLRALVDIARIRLAGREFREEA